jgi:hypothetical protein
MLNLRSGRVTPSDYTGRQRRGKAEEKRSGGADAPGISALFCGEPELREGRLRPVLRLPRAPDRLRHPPVFGSLATLSARFSLDAVHAAAVRTAPVVVVRPARKVRAL